MARRGSGRASPSGATSPGAPSRLGEGAPRTGDAASSLPGMSIRVGLGFDVHAFTDDPTRSLTLAGVVFDGARGLHGRSDADVVAHACADALLGAAGLGDIGEHFPDTDPQWAGADSLELLGEVSTRV